MRQGERLNMSTPSPLYLRGREGWREGEEEKITRLSVAKKKEFLLLLRDEESKEDMRDGLRKEEENNPGENWRQGETGRQGETEGDRGRGSIKCYGT